MYYVDKFNHCLEISLSEIEIKDKIFDELAVMVITNKSGTVRQKVEPRADVKLNKVKHSLMLFFYDYHNTEKYSTLSRSELNQLIHSKFSISISDIPDNIMTGDYLIEFKSITKQSIMNLVWDKLCVSLPYLSGSSRLVESKLKQMIYFCFKNKNNYMTNELACPTMAELLRDFLVFYKADKKQLGRVQITHKEDIVILSKLFLMSRFATEIQLQ